MPGSGESKSSPWQVRYTTHKDVAPERIRKNVA
jgi:hypothetical protein